MDVSVIVPSFNSARTIARCLESLLAQRTSLHYEIIVSDSSTDSTPRLLKSFEPRVSVIRSEKRLPPGPARNAGIARARGNIIAFTDADCVVAEDWVDQIYRAHEDSRLKPLQQKSDRANVAAASAANPLAIGGRILNGTPESLWGTALYLAEFVEFAGGPARQVASMPSCNISYRRSIFDDYGLFPDVTWGEEYIFNHRIAEGVGFIPDIVVRHVNRTRIRETVQHAYKVGHGCALSRHETGQAGFLFRYRFLVPLLWGYRFLKIGWSALRSGHAVAFTVAIPALAVDLAAWTLGFFHGTAMFRR